MADGAGGLQESFELAEMFRLASAQLPSIKSSVDTCKVRYDPCSSQAVQENSVAKASSLW